MGLGVSSSAFDYFTWIPEEAGIAPFVLLNRFGLCEHAVLNPTLISEPYSNLVIKVVRTDREHARKATWEHWRA